METNNTKSSNSYNFRGFIIKSVIIIILVLIFTLIIAGCLLIWDTNCILLNASDLADIKMAKKDLMSANTITFMVTLVVGLLASLLVFRVDKIDNLVNENKMIVERNEKIVKRNEEIEEKINEATNDISKIIKFDIIFPRVESIHHIVYIMKTITDFLRSQNIEDFKQVGGLCSRIDPLIYRIQESLNKQGLIFSEVTSEKRENLIAYIDEILLLLKEISATIKETKSLIYNNIDVLFLQMSRIKDQIEMIPIEKKIDSKGNKKHCT